jgi:AraC family transcriptional regulator, regulatory protein of adaptative response / DNA-3-methyladenine glycosylase II
MPAAAAHRSALRCPKAADAVRADRDNVAMEITADAAYQVLLARDARFDGHWFVGVTSTGIYCRPICRVRVPKREHCRFFDTHAQAEAAAFRPCLKCRPEIAPGLGGVGGKRWSVMDGSATLACQAAQLLEAQAAAGGLPGMPALAQRLGVTDRHLRRIFVATHGVTPLHYLQTRRLLLAKQLLTDSSLSIAAVASASGFGSTRQFNALFATRYRLNPRSVRTSAALKLPADAHASITATLAYRTPFDVARLLRFVAQRAIPGVERVDGLRVRRSVRAGVFGAAGAAHEVSAAGWIEAEFVPSHARVVLRFATDWLRHSASVANEARRWLDLDAAPHAIDAVLSNLPGDAGLRLPGSLDRFELAVRAVLGQQVTVAGARTLASRLVQRFGAPVITPWAGIDHCFPAPHTLACIDSAAIAELGVIGSRARAIVALAQAWPTLLPHFNAHAAPDGLIAALCALPGIGPWTAGYIAMRALGSPDVFLPKDVALLKAMHQQFGTTTQREADALAAQWQPWRSYAVLRLWNSLETPE